MYIKREKVVREKCRSTNPESMEAASDQGSQPLQAQPRVVIPPSTCQQKVRKDRDGRSREAHAKVEDLYEDTFQIASRCGR